MSTHITHGPEVLYRDRRFRVKQMIYGQPGRSKTWIEHWCRKRKARDNRKRHLQNWYGHTYEPENRGMLCERCQERPSEGLQAMFWFFHDETPK